MKKILLIVEGAKTEVDLFSRLGDIYGDLGDKFSFFSYNTNIYQLYRNIIAYGKDFVDTQDVLKKMCKTNSEKEMLNQKFAYIYLIFDYDAQDPSYDSDKLKELIDLFDEETERGLLFLNYPMMESYLDHQNYNFNKYKKNEIALQKLNGKYYKALVKKRGFKKPLIKYDEIDFENLMKLNLKKAFWLVNCNDLTYHNYLNKLTNIHILEIILEKVLTENKIPVLNTSVYFLVSYYGKKYFNKLFNILE